MRYPHYKRQLQQRPDLRRGKGQHQPLRRPDRHQHCQHRGREQPVPADLLPRVRVAGLQDWEFGQKLKTTIQKEK